MGRIGGTDGIHRAGRVAWALVGLALALALAGWLALKVIVVFPPLILAGALVFVLNPVINLFQRHRVPRVAGVALTYLGFAAAVGVLGFVLYPVVEHQAENLSRDWPEIQDSIDRWIDDRAAALEGTPFEFDRNRLGEAVTSDDSVREQIDLAADIGARIFHVLLVALLAPIFAFYLLVDLPHLRRTAESLIPAGARAEVMVVARRINRAVGGFFRGQLVVAFIVGSLASAGLKVIDLPFWLLIGMIAGFFNIIPLVGPYIGGVPALVVALTTREPITALWVVVVMVAVQQIDNHFISPVVMHRVVKLHPVLVMLALLLGGTLGGFFGLLIAVPTAAVVKILAGHLWRVHVLGEPLEQWEEEAGMEDDAPGVGFVAGVPGRDGVPGGAVDGGRDEEDGDGQAAESAAEPVGRQ